MKKPFDKVNDLDFGGGVFAQGQYKALGILEFRRCQVNQGADFPFQCYRVIQVVGDLYCIYESKVNTQYHQMSTNYVPIKSQGARLWTLLILSHEAQASPCGGFD